MTETEFRALIAVELQEFKFPLGEYNSKAVERFAQQLQARANRMAQEEFILKNKAGKEVSDAAKRGYDGTAGKDFSGRNS